MAALIGQTLAMYAVVVVVAFAVALVIRGIVLAVSWTPRRPVVADQPHAVPASYAPPPAHIAAIAAAVAAITSRARIVKIEDRARGSSWSAEGKFLHQTSHLLGRRRR